MDVNRETGEVDPNLMYPDDKYEYFELRERKNYLLS